MVIPSTAATVDPETTAVDRIAESGSIDTDGTELASRLRLAVTRLHRVLHLERTPQHV